jgi:hypothetical protein
MNLDRLLDEAEQNECMIMDDFDDCIIGMCESCDNFLRVAYDKAKVIAKLMEYSGMSEGDTTPVFVEKIGE